MRLARQHGNALAAYTCRLKLYFTMGEKEKFFEVLQELKESDIIIDNETLELIRISVKQEEKEKQKGGTEIMTMKWLTILQFLEIVAAYGIVTLFLPWLVLRKRFRRFSAAEQLTGYFFAGNFYIIYLVYLLQFLHISNRVTLTAGTVGPFLLVWIWKRRSKIPGVIEWVLENVERLLSGERGKKTSLVQLRGTIYRRFSVEKESNG